MADGFGPDLVSLLATGVGVLVATRSEDLIPAITRGWGPLFDADSKRLDVMVTAPSDSPTLLNLEANGSIAVTASQPSTYRTMQMRGVIDRLGPPTVEDRVRVDEHLERFYEEVAKLGVTSGAENLFLGDLRAVSFIVTETFDQTPGTGAGRRVP